MSLYNLLYPDNMSVHHFDGGGTVNPVATGVTETTVSDWAAPVVGGIVNAAVDAAANPYQVYGGKLVAGASDLQNKAFTGIQNLTSPNTAQTNAGTNMQDVYKSAATKPAYTGTTFTSNTTGIGSGFDSTALTNYMNPYLSQILNPQLEAARRNAGTTQMKTDADLIKQGAFGGGRQAIAGAENARNLNMNLADITGKGYNTAYTAAQAQYNADQDRLLKALGEKQNASEFGEKQGLDYLKLAGETAQDQGNFGNQLADRQLAANLREADLGSIQRDIDQQKLTSDYNLFKEQRDYPKEQIDYLTKVMKNFPMTTTNTYGEPTSAANSVVGGVLSGLSVGERIARLSGNSTATKTT
jgi:hypothetical protein